MPVDTPTPIKRALISVSDKTGLADFGRFLAGEFCFAPGGFFSAMNTA